MYNIAVYWYLGFLFIIFVIFFAVFIRTSKRTRRYCQSGGSESNSLEIGVEPGAPSGAPSMCNYIGYYSNTSSYLPPFADMNECCQNKYCVGLHRPKSNWKINEKGGFEHWGNWGSVFKCPKCSINANVLECTCNVGSGQQKSWTRKSLNLDECTGSHVKFTNNELNCIKSPPNWTKRYVWDSEADTVKNYLFTPLLRACNAGYMIVPTNSVQWQQVRGYMPSANNIKSLNTTMKDAKESCIKHPKCTGIVAQNNTKNFWLNSTNSVLAKSAAKSKFLTGKSGLYDPSQYVTWIKVVNNVGPRKCCKITANGCCDEWITGAHIINELKSYIRELQSACFPMSKGENAEVTDYYLHLALYYHISGAYPVFKILNHVLTQVQNSYNPKKCYRKFDVYNSPIDFKVWAISGKEKYFLVFG